jgi:hypothetical protein
VLRTAWSWLEVTAGESASSKGQIAISQQIVTDIPIHVNEHGMMEQVYKTDGAERSLKAV